MMTDEDLEKLMKQSVRKQTSKNIFWTILIIMLLVSSCGFVYAYQYNYWPFDKGKMQGVPNNTLVRFDRNDQTVMFGSEDGFSFNTNANQLVITMDYYQKAKKIDSTELLTVSANSTSANSLGGTVRWVQHDWGVTEDNLRIGVRIGENNQVNELYTIKAKTGTQKDNPMSAVAMGMTNDKQKIAKNIPYVIASWGFGNDSATSISYEDGEIVQSDLEKNAESYIMTVEFK